MTTGIAVATIVASTVTMIAMIAAIARETRRAGEFDRRMAHTREQALNSKPKRGSNTTSQKAMLTTIGQTTIRLVSTLAPVGAEEREKLTKGLREAGFAKREALSVFLSIKIATAATSGAGTAAWFGTTETGAGNSLLIVIAGALGFIIGGIAPEYALRARTAKRTATMSDALPDAMDLLVMCLDCGLTFERAVSTVATELEPIEPHLASELRLMEAELRVGGDRRRVLQMFQERSPVEGLKEMANTLLQSERYGTPLSQSMRNIADNERVNREARIENQTQRLPVLMTLPTLLFVVPGTMALIAGPAVITALQGLSAMGGTG